MVENSLVPALLGVLALLSTSYVNGFDPLQHSGPASPYFDAPSQDGIDISVPSSCVVDQAAYILRHGSRYPEPGSFSGWQALFDKFQNNTYTARDALSFIPFWTPSIDDEPHEPLFLSSTGAKEAFYLGVDLRKRYGFNRGGENLTVWAASQQRCVDTASYFLRGYLSQGNYLSAPSLNRGTIIALPDSVNTTFANSLTPSASCPTYNIFAANGSSISDRYRQSYRPAIARRLNTMLDGLVLDETDVGIMQDLCGFQAEIDGDTRFCDVFTEEEWRNYEYAHDLNYYYGSGPGNPVSAAVAYPWVKAITDAFNRSLNSSTNGTNRLIMGFTHDNNIPPIISALGLWNSSDTAEAIYPLSPTTPNPSRRFRSSYLIAFRGYVAIERMTCSSNRTKAFTDGSVRHIAGQFGGLSVSDNDDGVTEDAQDGVFIRIRANNAPILIPSCTSGPGSSCPLHLFAQRVDNELARHAGVFKEKCGLDGVSGIANEVQFLDGVVHQDEGMESVLVGIS